MLPTSYPGTGVAFNLKRLVGAPILRGGRLLYAVVNQIRMRRLGVRISYRDGAPAVGTVVSDEQPLQSPRPVHIAFFRAAGERDEHTPEYKSLLAGLVTLRLLDKWVTPGPEAKSALRVNEFGAVRRFVQDMPNGQAKDLLRRLVTAIGSFVSGRTDERVPAVIAYARLLERDAHWECASDTYETAIALIESLHASRAILPECYDRAAYCRRQAGDVRGAEPLLRQGQSIAHDLKDIYWWFRLRIALGLLELQRGNLGEAERLLDAIVAEAKRADLPEILARATHDRGQVAYARNQDDVAATLYFKAMMMYPDPMLARRAALDLASALGELGHPSYAVKVLRALRNGPDDGMDTRTVAGINLMRQSHLLGNEVKFDQLHTELRDERMTGRLRAHYLLTAYHGLKRFGRHSAAREALQRAIEVAEQYHVHNLVTDATALSATQDVHRGKASKGDTRRATLLPIFEAIDANWGPLAGAVTS